MTNNKLVPKLRFPEFKNDGEWRIYKLSDIAIKKREKNTSAIKLPVYTNSALCGVVNQEEYFDREIVTKDNLVNYSIVEYNDFVYNPRISLAAPVGPISRNKLSKGIMSPLYLIFKFNDGCIDFFEQYFKGNYWHGYIKAKANYGARFDRINIATSDFMDMPISYPCIKEQEKIAKCLLSLDKYIEATNQKLELLKKYKKGLIQKLFPARGKTIPELRFPEFKNDGEWEIALIGDTIKNIIPPKKLYSSEYQISGKYPIVDQSLKYIVGYSNDDTAVIHNKDFVIVFGDHTCVLKLINFPFIQGADGIKIFKSKFVDLITEYIYQYILVNPIIPIGYKRHFSDLKEKRLVYPTDVTEQCKIANCLLSLDKYINATNKKLELLKDYKKGLMQQLFSKL